jgi:hypothetical protein
MASPHLYVRSTDGSDADNGTTWALAKVSVAGAAAIDSTTDKRIWVSDNHAESNAAAQAWTFAGTAADPTWVVCVDDASNPEPPIATAATATCTTTGANGFTINGFCYLYGLTINCGSGAVNAIIAFDSLIGSVHQKVENCTLNIVATGGAAAIAISAVGNTNPSRVEWYDTDITLGAAGQYIRVAMADFVWEGGTLLTGPDLTSGLLSPNSAGEYSRSTISGVDLAEVGVTGFLVGKQNNCVVDVVFRNCKIPAFTTGGLYTGTLQPGDRIEMYNCDSADTNYRLWVADYFGVISSNTSIYNDAGADDGSAQGFSWEMVSTANTEFPHQDLVSPELVKWNETVTGTLTATVEIVHNSQGSGTNGALRDDEIWLEVMCLDPGGTPVGKWQSDMCANLNLNSNAADQASSTAAWTGDSAGWDTQKLSVSFTPKEKGYVHARVVLAKASATVYVDPLLTIA